MLDALSAKKARLVLHMPGTGLAGNPSADVADVKYAFGIEINI